MRSPIALIVSIVITGSAQGQELRAGAAKVDITPPTGFPMWGYAVRRDQPSLKVMEPLLARALVLETGGTRIAFVALDMGRAPTSKGRERIAAGLKKAGIGHFFVVASHTHHGPVLEVETWPDAKKPYVRELEDKIVAVALEAERGLKAARLGVGRAEVPFNRNRHSKRADAPVDRELVVIRVDDAKTGEPMGHLVNFAAHATMLPAKLREFAPDFPGALCREVEAKGGVCLFLQGAAGDMSPNPAQGKTAEAFGKKLAERVLGLSREIKTEQTFAKGWQAKRREFKFGSRVDLGNPIIRAMYAYAFFPDLVSFYEREYREGIRPEMTVALLDERIGFVGVSGEFFSGHALHLKKRARLEHLLFLGYCNDYHQYFPTIEAAAEGGYGADELVSPVEVGAGERMMDAALMELYRMRGRKMTR
ncbi:MAG: neutral/alkaline non-lysosomal ceramidase N-terminal domain-containing protein [Gemmataceae bacterium]